MSSMTINEAMYAIRAEQSGWAVPAFLATEAVAACCDIIFAKGTSPRDRLRAVETLIAIERLQLELKAAKVGEHAPETNFQLEIVELTSDEWRQVRETGMKPLEVLAKPLRC